MTQASTDPRALRTRQAIIGAVQELAAAGIAAPSVSRIARRAGISRSSFYTQFTGVDELTTEVFRAALRQITQDDAAGRRDGVLSDLEATRWATERLVEHVARHRELYRSGLPTSAAAYQHAIELVAQEPESASCLSAAPVVGVEVGAAATYLAGGMLAVLRAWIVGEFDATEEQLTAQLMALMPAWLT